MDYNANKPQGTTAIAQRPKFSEMVRSEKIQSMINGILGDPKIATRFVSSISSVVANNPVLQECDPNTVITSALVGEALQLPPSQQLGYFYLVPFDDRKNNRKVATFILGYKGYIQLAIRSGLYNDIDAMEVREGEYLGKDPDTGRPRFRFIEDDEKREALDIIGYIAFLELKTGFKKVIYWPYEKMLRHADTYSKAFNANSYKDFKDGKIRKEDEWKFSSFWYKQFDEMAKKTMLRQLISKFGIMSVDIQTAFERDATFADDYNSPTYEERDPERVVDNQNAKVRMETGATPPPITPEPAKEPEPQFAEEPATEGPLPGQESLFEKPKPTTPPARKPAF